MCYNKSTKQKGSKKAMRKVEYWIANDGKEFSTEEECFEYEFAQVELSDSIFLLTKDDCSLNKTQDFIQDLNKCYGIIIDDDFTAETLKNFFEFRGLENSPWEDENEVAAGHYFYSKNEWRWYRLETIIEDCKSRVKKMDEARKRA